MRFSNFDVEKMTKLGVFSYTKATMELTLVGVTYCFRHPDYTLKDKKINTVLIDAGYLTGREDTLKLQTYIGTLELLKNTELDTAVEDDFSGKIKFYEYVRDNGTAKQFLGKYHSIALDFIMGRIMEDVVMMLYSNDKIGEAHNIQMVNLENRYRLHLAKMVYFNSMIGARMTDVTESVTDCLYDANSVAVLNIGGTLYNLKLPYSDIQSVWYSEEFGLFEISTTQADFMFFIDMMIGYELYKDNYSVPYIGVLEKDIHYFENATHDNTIKRQILLK